MPTSPSKRSETLIGLDLATKCGWAALRGRKRLDSGRWQLLPSGQHRAVRWLELEKALEGIVREFNPIAIGFERVRRHTGTTAAHVYGGLLAVIEKLDYKWTAQAKIGQRPFAPVIIPLEISTWRKAACGRGNVDKQYVEKWVKRRFKYSAKNEDEAEALAIAEALRRIRRGEYTL